jgi:hypothetical protein
MLERMYVEIIVEGALQRDLAEIGGVDGVDAAALLARCVARGLQVELARRALQKVLSQRSLRQARRGAGKTADRETADQGQKFW